MLPELIADRLL